MNPETLELLKKHCKIDISYDDDLLEMYYEWAKEDIISSVTNDEEYDEYFFKSHKMFNLAVFPLTAYYYEQRLAYNERSLSYVPNMVLSVIHKIRSDYHD